MATLKSSVKVIYISYGSTDGLINNGQNYHTYLDQNSVTHIWQIEQGLGHEKRAWDRSFYNFAQRIFTASPTPVHDITPKAQNRARALLTNQAKTLRLLARPDGKGLITLDGRAVANGVLPISLPGSSVQ